MESARSPAFRGDIQGLRAVAVGAVVLAHAKAPGLAGGFVGVDVFFVISGFLITGLLLTEAAAHGRVSLPRFYARRARRILPAAALVIAVTTVAACRILDLVDARAVVSQSIWTSLFAANVKSVRDGTDYFAFDQAVSPLQHFWSLAVEEQFYLVWPVLLVVVLLGPRALRPRPSRRRRLLTNRVVVALLVIGGASLLLSAHRTATEPVAAYFSTGTRAWELCFGALLAARMPRLPVRVRVGLSWTGLGAIALAVLLYDSSTPFPGTAALVPVLGAGAVIAGGGVAAGSALLLGRASFRALGDVSYSLYLWHWPLLVLGAAYVGHPLTGLQTVGAVGLAVLLAFASFRLVENPLRHARRLGRSNPRVVRVLLPAAATSVLLVAVSVVVQPSPDGGRVSAAHLAPRTPAAAVAAVARAVAAAELSEPIPTGGLGRVHRDFLQIGACSGNHRLTNKVCEFGEVSGKHRVVVFGNSHATMWIPAVQVIAKDSGWRFNPIVKEGCNLHDFVNVTGRAQCSTWYAFAARTLKGLHPDLVVFPVHVAADQWSAAARQLAVDLKRVGTRVLVVSDAPRIQEVPLSCLQQQHATQRNCLWPQSLASLRASRDALRLSRQVGVEFVDVAPWFCHDLLCPSVISNAVPFVDHDHITATFSRLLAPALRPALRLTRA